MVEFELRTVVPAPRERAFARSLDIDLHVASMARSRERAVGGVTSGSIGLDEDVTWRAWHFGVPFRMTSRITELDAPHRFVDEQIRGPFASFRHEHRFEEAAAGTLMIDRVRFVAPLGVLGRVAELVLKPYLRRLIADRNAHLARELAG
ncbi:MAG: cyclase [Microbacterium sp.]|nr:cyclase [Microbacterium sp.]